ncbi:MAG: methyltransferase type 11 [Deltaproteobacteria bacterium RBG_13_49_15]|nr:MAG: methyltransferase type 11 [Deltaproteobacteria bacterium RBG_13_49_15]
MEDLFTSEENEQIQSQIRDKYRKVSLNPGGFFNYPTGRAGLEILGYDPSFTSDLPDEVSQFYCGVGNPFSMGKIKEGETVLDLGCGVGIDAVFAAKIVGSKGKVFGVDLVPEMLDRAKKNVQILGIANVSFIEGSAEKLDFPKDSFHSVISNGAINLIPDKKRAIAEVFRVLKPNGRFMVADQVLTDRIEKDLKARISTWFQ